MMLAAEGFQVEANVARPVGSYPHGTLVALQGERKTALPICTEDASRLFLTFADYILNRASWS